MAPAIGVLLLATLATVQGQSFSTTVNVTDASRTTVNVTDASSTTVNVTDATVTATTASSAENFIQLFYTCVKDCKLQYDIHVIRCGQQPTCLAGAAIDLTNCSCSCDSVLPNCAKLSSPRPLLAADPESRPLALGSATVALTVVDIDYCYEVFTEMFMICQQMSMNSGKQCACLKESLGVMCSCSLQPATTTATTTQWVNAVAACTADCKVQYDVDFERCGSSYSPQQCRDHAAVAMSTCGCSCKSRVPNAACSGAAAPSLAEASQNTTTAPTAEPSGDVGKCYDEFRDLFGRCQDMIEDSRKCRCILTSLDALCPCRTKHTSTTSISTFTPTTQTTTGPAPKPNPNIERFIECNKVCWQQTLDGNDRSSVLSLAQCNCHCMSASGVTGPQLSGAATSAASPGLRFTPTADVLYCYKTLNKTLEICSARCNATNLFPENCDWQCHKTFSEATCRCGATAAAGFGLAIVSVVGLVVWAVSP